MTVWTIKAKYDADAAVWYSIEGDIPGLAADGATFEILATKAGRMLPDLLEIHGDELDPQKLIGPHTIRLVAHHEHSFDIAA